MKRIIASHPWVQTSGMLIKFPMLIAVEIMLGIIRAVEEMCDVVDRKLDRLADKLSLDITFD